MINARKAPLTWELGLKFLFKVLAFCGFLALYLYSWVWIY